MNSGISQHIAFTRWRWCHALAWQGVQMMAGDGQMKAVVLPALIVAVQATFGIVAHDLGDYFECLGEDVGGIWHEVKSPSLRVRRGANCVWVRGRRVGRREYLCRPVVRPRRRT